MQHTYDTAKIRQTAALVKNVAQQVGDIAGTDLTRVIDALDSAFKGMAADELNQALTDLRKDIKNIAAGLEGIQKELRAFASRIDEADRRMADQIGKR
jgi:WXG100 family type VII secretion target